MRRLLAALMAAVCVAEAPAAPPASRPARPSVHERLSAAYLARFEQDRAALAARVRPIDVPYPLVRGTFHVHSRLSHDSRGMIEEIVAAAKATGTRVVGFTEHPRKDQDVIAANVRGWRDGLYFLAGTESDNALFWPGRDHEPDLRFVAHPEEVAEIEPAQWAGMEIYNTHADAKDEPLSALVSALLLNLPAVKAHPQAAFASFLDEPTAFLERFDRITRETPFTGIAANDSHQNQGLRLMLRPDGGLEAFDAEGESVLKIEGVKAAALRLALGRKDPPEREQVLAEVLLDPYEISMRHVGTYLQIEEVSEKSVRQALRTGRVVIGFEGLAPLPACGFWIEKGGRPVGTVGDRVRWEGGLSLRCRLPLPAIVRVVRDGRAVHEQVGEELLLPDLQPGVYRAEARLELAGERRPWVLTNPIYVK